MIFETWWKLFCMYKKRLTLCWWCAHCSCCCEWTLPDAVYCSHDLSICPNVINTGSTEPHQVVSHQKRNRSSNAGSFLSSLPCSHVGFVCKPLNVNWLPFGELSWKWLLSCDDVCPHSPIVMFLFVCVFLRYQSLEGIIDPVSFWPSLCWLQWIKLIKM